MTINNKFLKTKKMVFVEKNFAEATNMLKNSPAFFEPEYQFLLAYILFQQHNFQECISIYKKYDDFYKVGYCYLMLGNLSQSLEYFRLANDSPAKNWGIFFCELFLNQTTVAPTYLQIRAFLERDLSLFLKLKLADFVQKIIDISEFLEQINPEINKIIAKTFLYNDYTKYAKEYFIRAFEFTQNDAELYYLSALYYMEIDNKYEAKKNLINALKLNSNYIPAIEKLKSL